MKNIADQKIESFFAQFPEKKFAKGQIILKPEQELNFIFNIKSGYIKSYSINEGGFDLVINIYKAQNFFPITETLSQKTNPYYFEAITESVLQLAPTNQVHEFLKQDQEVLFDLTKRISSGLEGFMIRTQYLIRSSADQKVISSLVLLAKRFGQETTPNQIQILLPQTQSDIANFSGVSRETASLVINNLISQKLISQVKKLITVLDFEKLQQLSTIYHQDKALPFRY